MLNRYACTRRFYPDALEMEGASPPGRLRLFEPDKDRHTASELSCVRSNRRSRPMDGADGVAPPILRGNLPTNVAIEARRVCFGRFEDPD